MANCLFNAKEFNEAIQVCSKIIALDASFYYAYNRIGLCYIQLGDEEESKAFFEKALQIRPDYVEGLTNYAQIGDAYVAKIRRIISQNDMQRFETAQLVPRFF